MKGHEDAPMEAEKVIAVFPGPPVLMMTSGLQLDNGAPRFPFLAGELALVSQRRWQG